MEDPDVTDGSGLTSVTSEDTGASVEDSDEVPDDLPCDCLISVIVD